ncbi:MAG: hypothetical protein MUP28_00405 [Candidatus Aminicenantes bacterium]|jgi:hypothetical protein|nr:hypothetical protein [Candidatus Aminicenantes bacterium]
MDTSKFLNIKILGRGVFVAALWAFTIWLVYPLLTVRSVGAIAPREYIFRTVLGIGIMIILFGKTVTDLLFPHDLSGKKAVLYSVFLALYGLALLSGIVFMITRVIIVYLNTSISSTPQI